MLQKILHISFITTGILFLFLKENIDNAIIYFGLALAFDPFDPQQKFQERPQWQKWILYAELMFVFFLLGRLLFHLF